MSDAEIVELVQELTAQGASERQAVGVVANLAVQEDEMRRHLATIKAEHDHLAGLPGANRAELGERFEARWNDAALHDAATASLSADPARAAREVDLQFERIRKLAAAAIKVTRRDSLKGTGWGW